LVVRSRERGQRERGQRQRQRQRQSQHNHAGAESLAALRCALRVCGCGALVTRGAKQELSALVRLYHPHMHLPQRFGFVMSKVEVWLKLIQGRLYPSPYKGANLYLLNWYPGGFYPTKTADLIEGCRARTQAGHRAAKVVDR
jgi:hypothetical protein